MEFVSGLDWRMTLAIFAGVYILLWILRPIIKIHWFFEGLIPIAVAVLLQNYGYIALDFVKNIFRGLGLDI